MRSKNGKQRQKELMERIHADPERHAKFKEIERQRWHNRKAKLVANVQTERGQRCQRKKWREAQKKCRQLKKVVPVPNINVPHTPVDALSTPVVVQYGEPNELTIAYSECSSKSSNLSKKLVGRKKVRKDRSAAYRNLSMLKIKLSEAKLRSEMYRKRYVRLQRKHSQLSSPELQVEKLVQSNIVSNKVRRVLLFSSAMCTAVKNKYQCGSELERLRISKLVVAKFRKYRLMKFAGQLLGIKARKSRINKNDMNTINSRGQYESLGLRIGSRVTSFLIRDDNSRITTSKCDTITRKGCKKQRRLLSETMSRLHTKFLHENPSCKVSYSLFCKLRPFFVVPPTLRDRDTCLCKLHENGKLVIDRLFQLKLLPVDNIELCVKSSVCEDPTRMCYERKCQICKRQSEIVVNGDTDEIVSWFQWMAIKEPRVIKDKEVLVSRTVKRQLSGTKGDLCSTFHQLMPKLCWHLMVLKHQFKSYYELKDGKLMNSNSCLLVIDFSENYTCQRNREVQSAHFGASNQQVSLHTGVAYFGQEKVLSFCSLSDCCRHDPSAIWAHLEPVIEHIHQTHPEIDIIHFWSDGPTTQYRNKLNFLFVSRIDKFGLKKCTWNFFEAGHGKGAADAIGGVVKRCADGAVNTGIEVTDAATLYCLLMERTKVKMFLIGESSITENDNYLEQFKVNTVLGTMKLHQLVCHEPSQLQVRDLSCFCQFPELCTCHDARMISFPVPIQQQATVSPLYTSLTEDPSYLACQVIAPCATLLTAAVPPSRPSRAKKIGRANQVVEAQTSRATRNRSTSRVVALLEETLVTAVEAPAERNNAKKNYHAAPQTSQVLTLVTDIELPAKPSRARISSRASCEKLVSPAEHQRPKRNCRRNFSLAEAIHLIQADSDASD